MKKKLFIAANILFVGFSIFAMKAKEKIAKMKQVSALVKQIENAQSEAEVSRLQNQAQNLITQLNLKSTQAELDKNVQTRRFTLAIKTLDNATKEIKAESQKPSFIVNATEATFDQLLVAKKFDDNAAILDAIGDLLAHYISQATKALEQVNPSYIEQAFKNQSFSKRAQIISDLEELEDASHTFIEMLKQTYLDKIKTNNNVAIVTFKNHLGQALRSMHSPLRKLLDIGKNK